MHDTFPPHPSGPDGQSPLAGILAITVAAEVMALALAIAFGAGWLASLGLAWAGGTLGMGAGIALSCRSAIARRVAIVRRAALAQPAMAQPAAVRRATIETLIREDFRCPPML